MPFDVPRTAAALNRCARCPGLMEHPADYPAFRQVATSITAAFQAAPRTADWQPYSAETDPEILALLCGGETG